MYGFFGLSQSIDLDRLGKAKLFNYSGSISANGVIYDGTANRQAFTYYLAGDLNFNIAELYNIPLSFAYSNQNFDFSSPFKLNRLSMSPSYKWITAHVGDVAMTFSPYTLNGHQFTGVGVDLSPNGPFKFSAMYGRFLKATEYDPDKPQNIVAYYRSGYGLKASYAFEKVNFGMIFFKATDDENSLKRPFPFELGLSPKNNVVASLETNFKVLEKADIKVEYAVSGITEDIRVKDPRSKKGPFSLFLNENITTHYFKAFNTSFDYVVGNGSMGAKYERIDPNYRTFGAYYFNNDLENIAINASQTIFNNTLNIGVNVGLQRDNLDKAKSSDMKRLVSSINLNYTPTEKLGINGSFSNFQSYTNIRDQFDYINQVDEFDNVDTLNYRQISQNANLGLNYTLKQTDTQHHRANINLVYQNSNNKQDGKTMENGASEFYNGTVSHSWGYPKKALTIILAANSSYSKSGETDTGLTLGPTLGLTKQLFDKKLRTSFSASYNTLFANGEQQNQYYNLRLGGNYTWLEKHVFSLNVLSLFRNTPIIDNKDFSATFGYTFSFNGANNKGKRGIANSGNVPIETLYTFRYRDVIYSGTPSELDQQLENLLQQSGDLPQTKKEELNRFLTTLREHHNKSDYKEIAITFLDGLYHFKDFKKRYEGVFHSELKSIMKEVMEKGNVPEFEREKMESSLSDFGRTLVSTAYKKFGEDIEEIGLADYIRRAVADYMQNEGW